MAIGESQVEAGSELAAREQISTSGAQVLSVRRSGWPWNGSTPRTASPAVVKRSRSEVALICKEVRALLIAGLSVVEALEALAAQHSVVGAQRQAVDVFGELLERLRAGRPLSAAMVDVGGFPALLVASVQSSERTSNLVQALDAYLRYDEMVGALQRKVVSAALYPAIVVTLGLAIAVFLLWVVIPRFAGLYGQMGSGAGSATLVLLSVSRTLKSQPAVVPLGLLSVVAVVVFFANGRRWQRALQKVMHAVPMLDRQGQHFERARLFEALALLVRGGYSLHEALELCKGIAASDAARRRIAQAQAGVERGSAASLSFAEASLTDQVTERLLRAGERGGDFADVLQAISRRHATTFETFVERATRVVEPLLLLGVAVLIGSMVVLLYMPIFDIAGSIR
jgi:general secretion pathway protein F